MAISQPLPTDPLNAPDHALMHRILGVDLAAPVKSLQVDAAGNVVGKGIDKVRNASADATAGFLAEKLATLFPTIYQRDMAWALKTPYITAGNRYIISTPNQLSVDINNTVYFLTVQAELNLSLDTSWDAIVPDYRVAANRAGKDFYIYACIPSSGSAPKLLVSANSTIPAGYTAANSRKIGGFHCLCMAVGTIAGHSLTGFATGDVLPASVWDLKWRADNKNMSNVGMTYDEGSSGWEFIYLGSNDGAGGVRSIYNATILDSINWMDYGDRLAKVGLIMGDDLEFASLAAGSNEETNISTSLDPGTTGGHSDGAPGWVTSTAYSLDKQVTPIISNGFIYRCTTAGTSGATQPTWPTAIGSTVIDGTAIWTCQFAVRRMISNIGCEDCAGVMWQWLRDQSYRSDGIVWTWHNLPGAKGSLFRQGTFGDVKLLAGGSWNHAAFCGSRCRDVGRYRWYTSAAFGGRGRSRKL